MQRVQPAALAYKSLAHKDTLGVRLEQRRGAAALVSIYAATPTQRDTVGALLRPLSKTIIHLYFISVWK